MKSEKPRRGVRAGDTRSVFGEALDQQLPLPEQRRAFRRWRHTRPFWGGVFAILGGLVIISYPLGPMPSIMAIGAAALTGITIGLILIIGGLFFWFAPHQRMFVAIVLMLMSILSLVVTNLGGFFLGMIFGMLGSSMGFGWKPGADFKRKGASGAEPEKPSPAPRGGSSATKRAAAIGGLGMLLTSAVAIGGHAEPALAQQEWPSTGCGETPVNAETLIGEVTIVKTLTLPVRGNCPPVEVIRIFVHEATLTQYHLESPPTSTGEVMQLITNVKLVNTELFATRLHADIKLGALLGVDLPIDPPLPSGAVPITPDLVNLLGTVPEVLPLERLKLDATNASLGQPLALSPRVDLTDFAIRVVPGPTIGVGPRR